jgi:hypothetical protein
MDLFRQAAARYDRHRIKALAGLMHCGPVLLKCGAQAVGSGPSLHDAVLLQGAIIQANFTATARLPLGS